jgi:uncharacterized repeat protein (TIGR01451 family)
MRSRSFLILLLILSLALLPSLQLALAASSSSSSSSSASSSSSTKTSTTSTVPAATGPPLTQRLDIYTSGSNDYWLVTLSPVNATKSGITAAESVSGVNAYQLTAVEGSTALAGSPLFWPGGYNILHIPSMPYSGVFLNITATSQSAAQSAVSDFDALLGVSLQQVGSSGNNYTYFAPSNFGISEPVIFGSIPSGDNGLTSVATASSLAADPTPTAILTGVRSGASFNHTVRFGSTESGGVGTNGSLLLENAISLSNDSFVTSSNAVSTKVVVHALDGLITSKDTTATVTNHPGNFSSTYSIGIPAGTRYRPSVTITHNPPVLVATRTVNGGSATSGGLISLTLNFANTADNGTINNIKVNDSWWSAYPSLFSFSAGQSNVTVASLVSGQNKSQAYSLKVTSTASQNIIIPAAVVTYSYTVANTTIKATTMTNELEVRANSPGPVIIAQARSSITSGSAFGKPGHYIVSVSNGGDDPALNVNVLNYTDATLSPGAVWNVNVSLSYTSIENRNLSASFNVGWTSPDGSKGNLTSNPVNLLLSHSGILVPFVEFKITPTITAKAFTVGNVNATWYLTNKGSAASGNVTVNEPFPSGVTCKSVLTGNGTCTTTGFTVTDASLAVQGNITGTVELTFSKDNYLTQGATVVTRFNNLNFTTYGSTFSIASGIGVTKTYSPPALFQTQDSNVTVDVTNQGTAPLYNVSLTATSDTFDTKVSGSLTSFYPTLAPSSSQSLNYSVKMTAAGNNRTGAPTSLSYLFGGYATTYPVNSSGSVTIYQALTATTSVSSTPTEGKDFSLNVNIQNSAPVNVTNVSVSFPLPLGLSIVSHPSQFQVSGRTVTLTIPTLGAGATSTNSITLKPALDTAFTLGTGNLTFDYLGKSVSGTVTTSPIVANAGVFTYFELPTALAVVLVLVIAIYMHRRMSSSPSTK